MPQVQLEEKDAGLSRALVLTAGVMAGFAVGMFVAQRFGGMSAVASRIRTGVTNALDRGHAGAGALAEGEEDEDLDEEEFEDDESRIVLEDRVLEVFKNDPILAERPIDIGVIDDGVVELDGWVREVSEVAHATTIARGIPGVAKVHNYLDVEDETDGARDVPPVRGATHPRPVETDLPRAD